MDIAYQDQVRESKEKNFFTTTARQAVDPELAKALLNQSAGVEQVVIERSRRAAYNQRIFKLDPRYAALKPIDSFIVRLMVREGVQTKSGLILPSANRVQGKTRNGYDDDPVEDPYNFTQKAIIVAAPAHESILVPGTLVHIAGLQVIVHERVVVGYESQYLHPDYPNPIGPTMVDHQDFGYAIIQRPRIRVIIAEKGSFESSVLVAGESELDTAQEVHTQIPEA